MYLARLCRTGLWAMIGSMKSGWLRAGHAGPLCGPASATVPQVQILAAAALLLTNIPLARYNSGGHPGYEWAIASTLLLMWQVWRHGRLAWAALTVATAVALILYGLSISRVINIGLPGWWIAVGGLADIAALIVLLSPPIRRWVFNRRPTGVR